MDSDNDDRDRYRSKDRRFMKILTHTLMKIIPGNHVLQSIVASCKAEGVEVFIVEYYKPYMQCPVKFEWRIELMKGDTIVSRWISGDNMAELVEFEDQIILAASDLLRDLRTKVTT